MITNISSVIAMRGPLRDGDCYWDYGKARCAWPEFCVYRFIFCSSEKTSLSTISFPFLLQILFCLKYILFAGIFLGMFTSDRAVG